MSRTISPPLSKRRRVEEREATTPIAQNSTKPSLATESLQVYSWNVNGIQPFIQKPITFFFSPTKGQNRTANPSSPETPLPKASLRDLLQRHGVPTILFLQEVKISPSDEATQRAVERAVRRPATSKQATSSADTSTIKAEADEPDYRAFFCLPRDKHNARGFGQRVYGVCSIVRTDFLESQNATVRTVDWDLEGRFQIIETNPPHDSNWPKLSIWNIYAVNGTDFEYRDSMTGLPAGTRHDRKLAVHKLMLDECLRLEKEGFSVILAGDLNIARDLRDGHPRLRTFPEQHVKNRQDFNAKFFEDSAGLRAVDTFRHLHGDERRYTYYPRGGPFGYSCDRVDLILCSRSLEDRLKTAGMLDSPAERGPSDHIPLYASFRFAA